ncbi:MAG: hypothetical protein M1837_003568 [Sclerophora amabilis]|nr:MAG: hypothetical protein M1837_003568 [Sclerophora amabilis]
MVMHWNDQADARLFTHTLKIHNVKLDYPALAAAMGEGVTPKAIQHRIQKLRAFAANEENGVPYSKSKKNQTGIEPNSPPETPQKATKSGAAGAKSKTPSSTSSFPNSNGNDGNGKKRTRDEGDVNCTPSKKRSVADPNTTTPTPIKTAPRFDNPFTTTTTTTKMEDLDGGSA